MGQRYGLKISEKKAQLMAFCMSDPAITVGGKAVEKVTKFTYLGSCFTEGNDTEYEISVRIGKAASCVARLKKHLEQQETGSTHQNAGLQQHRGISVAVWCGDMGIDEDTGEEIGWI